MCLTLASFSSALVRHWPPHLPGASQHRPGLLSTAAPLWHSPCPAAPPACAQGFELGISGLVLTFLLRDEGPRLLIGHSLRARGCVCVSSLFPFPPHPASCHPGPHCGSLGSASVPPGPWQAVCLGQSVLSPQDVKIRVFCVSVATDSRPGRPHLQSGRLPWFLPLCTTSRMIITCASQGISPLS